MENKNQPTDFNGRNEKQGLRREFEKEQEKNEPAEKDDLSLNDSIRNQGQVSGTTFGAESNPAKFSNLGEKNQQHKEENNSTIEDVNQRDQSAGNRGTSYSDYLYDAEKKFVSTTGTFSNEGQNDDASGDSTRPFDAMQGNREHDTGGRTEPDKGYDPSSDERRHQ